MKVGRILGKAIPNIDAIDVELLMASVLHLSRAMLKAYPERDLTDGEKERFDSLLQRRINGEPVAYLVGHKEFWSLHFIITPEVLIPRPDTELLVEMALERIEETDRYKVLDLGTGSGAIALSVASERPEIKMLATDASDEALQIARLNAKNLHIKNVDFIHGSWFKPIEKLQDNTFDIILSNPPYVAKFDSHLSQGDLRFEPAQALVSGVHGMDDLEEIISNAPKYLSRGGALMVEHGYDQQTIVAKGFAQAGFSDITCFKDLSGIPRVTTGVLDEATRC